MPAKQAAIAEMVTFAGNYYEVSGAAVTKYYGVYPAEGRTVPGAANLNEL